MVTVIDADDVEFNASAIAGAWEATRNALEAGGDQVPVCVAVAITNEFTDYEVTAAEGEESDRDVLFHDSEILFEEKAVGVCSREIAEEHAPAYVEMGREETVLAVNPAQIMEHYPAALKEEP